MRQPLAQAICSQYGLGRLTRLPVLSRGGFSHRVWQLTTSHGRFAVKVLNRNFEDPEYVRSIRKSHPG